MTLAQFECDRFCALLSDGLVYLYISRSSYGRYRFKVYPERPVFGKATKESVENLYARRAI